jgi:Uma2 family endonuclease
LSVRPLEYADDKRDTVTNPRLVVEVLSPSTRNYDRSEKLRMFRMAPSIEEYLLIEQTPVEIEHGRRMANGHWDVETILDSTAVIQLLSIDCQLPVTEIYKRVDTLL